MNDFLRLYGPPVGRILLAVIFVLSGFGKLTNAAGTAGYMASHGIPFSGVLVWITGIVELGGGLMLVVGFKARLAAVVLFLFTIAATVIFHPWWSDPSQKLNFLKNLCIMGGMLYVAAHGAGRFGIDREDGELSL